MATIVDNIAILSDLLTLGAPVVLGLLAMAYLVLLLSWQKTSASVRTHADPPTQNRSA